VLRKNKSSECRSSPFYDEEPENPAWAIASSSPLKATEFFGLRNDDIPSFQACTICLATVCQRGSFRAASITSWPTSTAESHSLSTISAYCFGAIPSLALKNRSKVF